MKNTIGQRIESFLKQENIGVEKFAKMVGVSRSAVYQWIADESEPAAAKKILIMKLFPKLNPSWFLFGRGDMTLEGAQVVIDELENTMLLNEDHPLYKAISKHSKEVDDAVSKMIQAKDILIEQLMDQIQTTKNLLESREDLIESLISEDDKIREDAVNRQREKRDAKKKLIELMDKRKEKNTKI